MELRSGFVKWFLKKSQDTLSVANFIFNIPKGNNHYNMWNARAIADKKKSSLHFSPPAGESRVRIHGAFSWMIQQSVPTILSSFIFPGFLLSLAFSWLNLAVC